MCGIVGLLGRGWAERDVRAMLATQHHRGPDAHGTYVDPSGLVALGHNRLSIIDTSNAGAQPMFSTDGRYCIVFNGEIYNYVELRAELSAGYTFRSRSDTEVILAAYQRWGAACLDRFIGMFALLIWDRETRTVFGARDRFGVKPMYYRDAGDRRVAIGSEIRTLAAVGDALTPDPVAWASYLALGVQDHGDRTFWAGVRSVPAGHALRWTEDCFEIFEWYSLADRVGTAFDERSEADVAEEYRALMADAVRLRFRSDVPVGINLSGGLDSSALLALVQSTQGADSDVSAFTFVTGDPAYDETPWVEQMLAHTRHPLVQCRLTPHDVPALAESVHAHHLEPFGGLPTLAYARLFEEARSRGVIVLLDGQGMDEQWAGYSYYRSASVTGEAPLVQGSVDSPVRPDALAPEFRALARPLTSIDAFPDMLRNLQLRDATHTKLPRALRYNDRVSMRASIELREPFLDARLFELALRQPADRKIRDGVGKWMLRSIVRGMVPAGVVEAPKRPLQTPQREWLRGPLRDWAEAMIDAALGTVGDAWLRESVVRDNWARFCRGEFDNSVFVWQWISIGLMADVPQAAT